jgi:hypothetical protein
VIASLRLAIDRPRAEGLPPVGDRPDDLLGAIAADFPTLRVEVVNAEQAAALDAAGERDGRQSLSLCPSEWLTREIDTYREDERVRRAATGGLFDLVFWCAGREAAHLAPALLTRYQRFIGRRNEASQRPSFDGILERHRFLFADAATQPLLLADYEHALDTWHWMLRLDPDAELAPQIAALFHDLERLTSEAAAIDVLRDIGLDGDTLEAVHALIARHEHRGSSPEAALLADSDALSFFSLNSTGYFDYFGESHTRRKVAFTLARLRPSSRTFIDRIWFRADVARLVHEIARFA